MLFCCVGTPRSCETEWWLYFYTAPSTGGIKASKPKCGSNAFYFFNILNLKNGSVYDLVQSRWWPPKAGQAPLLSLLNFLFRSLNFLFRSFQTLSLCLGLETLKLYPGLSQGWQEPEYLSCSCFPTRLGVELGFNPRHSKMGCRCLKRWLSSVYHSTSPRHFLFMDQSCRA